MATNQVLDLTQRKKFCSSHCFKASNYYQAQLSTLPPTAWTTRRAVQLLSVSGHTPQASETKAPDTVSELVIKERTPSSKDNERDQLPADFASPSHTGHTPFIQSPSSQDTPPSQANHTPRLDSLDTSSSCNTPPSHSDCSPSTQSHDTHHILPVSSMDSLCLNDTPPDSHLHDEAGSDTLFTNKYIQQIFDGLNIWLSPVPTNLDLSDDVLYPPLHDMCVTQVQKSLFLCQLHSTLQSLGGASEVVNMASSFRLTNKCITFRPPQWKIIVFLLIALCHGEEAVNWKKLTHSLTELKATEEDFYALLRKAHQLHVTPSPVSSSDSSDEN